MSAAPRPRQTLGQPHYPAADTAHNPGWRGWLSFVLQIGLLVGVELGDDIVRGVLLPPDRRIAVANALRLVRDESALGLWVERPAEIGQVMKHGGLNTTGIEMTDNYTSASAPLKGFASW